ncbi:MAG TPA: DUF2127 domain-containing protein [Acidobacteriaceae bacterium]|jgi:uncharacterized membrane protein (DUF2068 family)|nr:DUF2127 domain-containing protein [Acidobacteriaceae bacterium]
MAKQETQGSQMQHRRTGNGRTRNGRTRNGRTRNGRDRWLIAIGAFKVLEGLLLILLGLGIVRLLHRDIGDLLLHLATSMRIDPESHFVNLLLEKVQLLTPPKIRLISAGIFLKAGLDFVEGIGLALEKTWAEWLTIGLTASFLPWEIFELVKHFTWLKVGITLLNVLVLLYLVWVQQLRLRAHRRTH